MRSQMIAYGIKMPHPETRLIISRAETTLQTAKYGLDDLTNGPPERKLAGISNLIAFGRAVTNVLQNLRHKEEGFEKWYAPYEKDMRSDELMLHFYKLRSEILKEGNVGTRNYAHIKSFNFSTDMDRLPPAPPNAKALFIGDKFGRSGWEVELPDGSIVKYYINIPSDIGESGIRFIDPPTMHGGKKIEDNSIENLCRIYYNYLENMVKSAKETFLPEQPR